MERQGTPNGRSRPACVGMEEAASIFGWPHYYLPFLVRAGHLKPLEKPAQNARKWFATVEIERMSCEVFGWIQPFVAKQIHEMNKKRKGNGQNVSWTNKHVVHADRLEKAMKLCASHFNLFIV